MQSWLERVRAIWSVFGMFYAGLKFYDIECYTSPEFSNNEFYTRETLKLQFQAASWNSKDFIICSGTLAATSRCAIWVLLRYVELYLSLRSGGGSVQVPNWKSHKLRSATQTLKRPRWCATKQLTMPSYSISECTMLHLTLACYTLFLTVVGQVSCQWVVSLDFTSVYKPFSQTLR